MDEVFVGRAFFQRGGRDLEKFGQKLKLEAEILGIFSIEVAPKCFYLLCSSCLSPTTVIFFPPMFELDIVDIR